ncbi:hypothetical protein DCAR_0417951 [Daucus carota subsp. sativus]|uniref:Lysine--tRNA ligase n=1 Tax=Daucus carota subsp. sativus TaxID=79200 RepID=A0A165Z1I6_DAUCS|nr:hypothetical protein DCAR_0417951 [Daucus carota subsp. sativus]
MSEGQIYPCIVQFTIEVYPKSLLIYSSPPPGSDQELKSRIIQLGQASAQLYENCVILPSISNVDDKTIEEDVASLSVADSATTLPEAGTLSKNALKKELKNQQREEERRRKEEEMAAAASSNGHESLAAVDDDMDPTQYFDNRIKALGALKAAGINPYPQEFNEVMPVKEYVDKYSYLNSRERLENVQVSLAGRIMNKRASSSKLFFYDLHGDGAKVQLMIDARISDFSEAEFTKIRGVKRGDIVVVDGFPGKSRRGELSMFPKSFTVVSHCLRMMPYVLKDQETRYRQRDLDLILSPGVRHNFETRAMIIVYVRRFLGNLDFLEVETPMMNMFAGGAAARPFETYHNDLKMRLNMRIAPELHLKRLVVGGFNRVYEIGKQFRNEGIDLTHNPEFTTVEFYMAFADYKSLIEITEQMLSGKNGQGADRRRIDMIEELEKMSGLDIPKDLASDEANKYLAEACTKFEIKCAPPLTTARLLDKLVGHFLEETCVNPTFIMNHPKIMSPLAKSHRSEPGLTERFELFVNKHERQRFADQLKDRQSGDDEAMDLDESFLTALEHGLPPTAGWGMGIDRLAMLLTDSQNIKEVILFPLMKPQDV